MAIGQARKLLGVSTQKRNLEARFVLAIERERVQIDIRAQEYGTPVALGVDDEPHMEIAWELDMVNALMIQHDVIVFGIQ